MRDIAPKHFTDRLHGRPVGRLREPRLVRRAEGPGVCRRRRLPALARGLLYFVPTELADRRPGERRERDVVAEDAFVRRQLYRQALELEPQQLSHIDSAPLA